MKKWLERIGRAVVMGLAWAAAWIPLGVTAGFMIVGVAEPEHIGGPLYAGFLCGALFSAVAGIAAGRRRLGELSLVRAGAWGAVSGLLVGGLPYVLGSSSHVEPWWMLPVAVAGGLTLLSAMTAVGAVLLARMAKRKKLLDAGTTLRSFPGIVALVIIAPSTATAQSAPASVAVLDLLAATVHANRTVGLVAAVVKGSGTRGP